MTDPRFESKPRWEGAPPVCIHANLLCFDSEQDALDYHEHTAPKAHIDEIFRCVVCEKWHYLSTYPLAKRR